MTPNLPDLEGKRVLVTGAASGIGLATARLLAASGARVCLSDRPGDALDAAAAEIPRSFSQPADLTDASQIDALLRAVGEVHILVNNAGLQHVSPVEDFPAESWDTLIAVMLTAPFLLTKGVLPGMYAGGWGRIVNVASVHGLVASPFKSAYVSAKHGLLGFTKTVALEAAARCQDVTVHAICPSYVRTPLVEAQVESQAQAHGISPSAVLEDVLLAPNAVKRLIEPEQVAELVGVLCGPSAWTMTGSALTMDAGWLAH